MPDLGRRMRNFSKGRLEAALLTADKNQYIQGWHANGVRARLDGFIRTGLAAQFKSLPSKEEKALVHMDFSKLSPPTTEMIVILPTR